MLQTTLLMLSANVQNLVTTMVLYLFQKALLISYLRFNIDYKTYLFNPFFCPIVNGYPFKQTCLAFFQVYIYIYSLCALTFITFSDNCDY